MRLELSLAHVAIVGCLHHLLIGSRLQVQQVVRGGRPRHIGTQAEGGLGKLRGGLDRLRVVGVKFLHCQLFLESACELVVPSEVQVPQILLSLERVLKRHLSST